MIAIYDVATTKLQVLHNGTLHHFMIDEMDEWNSIVNSNDDAFDIQLWGEDYISGEFPTHGETEYGFQFVPLAWNGRDDNWEQITQICESGLLILTENGQMVDNIITGVVKDNKLVDKKTGDEITNAELPNTKFDKIWIEVFKSHEEDGTETIENCDTISEAMKFIEEQDIVEGVTLYMDFWFFNGEGSPEKLDASEGILKIIKEKLGITE